MLNIPLFVLNNINYKNHITNLENQNRYNINKRSFSNKETFPEHFKFLSLDNDKNEDL